VGIGGVRARALGGVLTAVSFAMVVGVGSGAAVAQAAPTGPVTGATASVTASALPAADVPAPGAYRALPPARLVDTRLSGGRLTSGARLVVPLLGRQGVPSSGVGAVQLHVTAVGASAGSHLTVTPSGAAPTTSSLNYEPSRAVANTVTTRPGADGAVVVTNGSASVDVIVDLIGWAASTATPDDAGLHVVTPRRVLDSRTAGAPIGTSGTSVVVTGGAVPSTARAVLVNLTTVGASANGLPLLSWATGAVRPTTSNGNTVKGAAIATQVVVGIGTSGRISLATGAGTTHVVVDVLGYLMVSRLASPVPDGQLRPVPPVRLVDTRSTGVPLASGQRLVQQVTGRGGVPSGASAALITITAVPGTKSTGTLVAVGNGERQPPTSDLNPRVDVAVARQVLTPLGVDGGIAVLRSGGSGHVVVDLVGYVTAVPRPTATPPSAALLGQGVPGGPLGPQAADVLRTSVKYGLTTWWSTVAPALLARPMDAAAQTDTTDAIRRLSMEALGVSTALATGVYDPTQTGMSQAQALAVVNQVVTRVACRHRGTVIGGWGQTWQSTLWSSLAARAAWLSWGTLPQGTRSCVEAMVRSEADFASTIEPVTMGLADGTVTRPGDTAAEEDSWYALAPAVAVAMMPTAERRDVWRAAQVRLLATAWARLADLTANPVVDGVPLSQLVSGYNVEADGTVVNHKRIAPDYSTNAYQNVDAILVATLAGHQAPQAALQGLGTVYGALGSNTYVAGATFLTPGGTVYVPQAPFSPARYGVYYPQGCDWGLGQVLPYALLDAEAAAYGFGGPAGTVTDAAAAASRHLAEAATMQQRGTDGRMFLGSSEYVYVGREEHTAQLAAQLVLALTLSGSTGGVPVVAPAGISPATPDQLRTPPAPSDERRLMSTGQATPAG